MSKSGGSRSRIFNSNSGSSKAVRNASRAMCSDNVECSPG